MDWKVNLQMLMLLQVDKEENGIVEGTHIQWCCACSLEEATIQARETERANGNHITVAVIDEPYDTYVTGKLYKESKRLDTQTQAEDYYEKNR